jgi:hypothetical protein
VGGLLNFVFGQVAVRFGKFSQSRPIVAVRFGDSKAAQAVANVGLDVQDTVNFF